jgi:hypothetical protein
MLIAQLSACDAIEHGTGFAEPADEIACLLLAAKADGGVPREVAGET